MYKKLISSTVMLSLLICDSKYAKVVQTDETQALEDLLTERVLRSEIVKTPSDSKRQQMLDLHQKTVQNLSRKKQEFLDPTFMLGFEGLVQKIEESEYYKKKELIDSLKELMSLGKEKYSQFADVFDGVNTVLDKSQQKDHELEPRVITSAFSKSDLDAETLIVQKEIDTYVHALNFDVVIAQLIALPKVQGWVNNIVSSTSYFDYEETLDQINLKDKVIGKYIKGNLDYINSSDKRLSKRVLTKRLDYVFQALKQKFEEKSAQEMLSLMQDFKNEIAQRKGYYKDDLKNIAENNLEAAWKLKEWAAGKTLNVRSLSKKSWDLFLRLKIITPSQKAIWSNDRTLDLYMDVLISRIDQVIALEQQELARIKADQQANGNKNSLQKQIQEEDIRIENKLKAAIASRTSSFDPVMKTKNRIELFKKLQKWIEKKSNDIRNLSDDVWGIYDSVAGYFGNVTFLGTVKGVSWDVLEKRVQKGLFLEQEHLKKITPKKSGRSSSSSYSAPSDKDEWYAMSPDDQRVQIENKIASMEKSTYLQKNFRKDDPQAKFIYARLLTDLKQEGVTDDNAFDKAKELGLNGIKKQYRQWSLKLHPDKNGGDEGKKKEFQYLAYAYDSLTMFLTQEPF